MGYATVIVPVAGVSFADGYPDNLHRLREAIEADFWREPLPVILVRNPANPHDRNAVEVHVPALGAMIGHLPRDVAKRIAPLMDDGVAFNATVDGIRVNRNHPERPGADIAITRATVEASV